MSENKEPSEKVRNNYLKKREELFNKYEGDNSNPEYLKEVIKIINTYQKKYPSSDFFKTDTISDEVKNIIIKKDKKKEIKATNLNYDVIKQLKNLKKNLLKKRSFTNGEKYHLEDDYNVYIGYEIYNNDNIQMIAYDINKSKFINTIDKRINEAIEYKSIKDIKYIVRFIININMDNYIYGPLKVVCIINKIVNGDVEKKNYKIGTIYYTNKDLLINKFNIKDLELIMNSLLVGDIDSNPIDIKTLEDLKNIKKSNIENKARKKIQDKETKKENKEREKLEKERQKRELSEYKKTKEYKDKIKQEKLLKNLPTVEKELNKEQQSKLYRQILGYALNAEIDENKKPKDIGLSLPFKKTKSYIRSVYKKLKGKHLQLKPDTDIDRDTTTSEKWQTIMNMVRYLYENNPTDKIFIALKNYFNKLDKLYKEERPELFFELDENEKQNLFNQRKQKINLIDEEKDKIKMNKEIEQAKKKAEMQDRRKKEIEMEKQKEKEEENNLIKYKQYKNNLALYKDQYKKIKRKIREENEEGGAPKKMVDEYKRYKQVIEEYENFIKEYENRSWLGAKENEQNIINYNDDKEEEEEEEEEKEEDKRFLSDWLEINKSATTDHRLKEEKLKALIYDEMFNIIDNKYSKNDILDFGEKLNIPNSVFEYYLNWWNKKMNSGGTPEYSDFVSKVIYPQLKKYSPKDVDTIKLMLYANDIANDGMYFGPFFKKDNQLNKYTIIRSFYDNKINDIIPKLKKDSEYKNLIEDLQNMANVGEGFQNPNYKPKSKLLKKNYN